MRAIWRCRCCGKAVGGRSGLISGFGSGSGSGLLVPRQKPGQPQRTITSEEGSTRKGSLHYVSLEGHWLTANSQSSRLESFPISGSQHSTAANCPTAKANTEQRCGSIASINRNRGLVRQLSLHDVMESWKWKRYEMRWERVRESSTNNHQNSPRNRHWGGLRSGAPTTEPTVYSQRRETRSLELWVSYCSDLLPDIRGTFEGLLGPLAATPFPCRRSRRSRRGLADAKRLPDGVHPRHPEADHAHH